MWTRWTAIKFSAFELIFENVRNCFSLSGICSKNDLSITQIGVLSSWEQHNKIILTKFKSMFRQRMRKYCLCNNNDNLLSACRKIICCWGSFQQKPLYGLLKLRCMKRFHLASVSLFLWSGAWIFWKAFPFALVLNFLRHEHA